MSASFRTLRDSEALEITIGTGNTGWTNVWRYGDKTNYHMTNLGGTFRTLDNVDGRCELEQGILSQVSLISSVFKSLRKLSPL